MFRDFFAERFLPGNVNCFWNRVGSWPILFVIAFLGWLIEMILNGGPVFSPDSESYITALQNLERGRLDLERTPGMPLILGACKFVFGGWYLWVFCLLQECVFLGSVVLLWDIGRRFISSRRIVIGITLCYLFLPSVSMFYYTVGVDTESFAFAICMLLVWLSVRLLECRRKWNVGKSSGIVVLINFVLLAGIAVRPAYIYLLPVYFVFWVFLGFGRKGKNVMTGITGMTSLAAVGLLLMAYQREIKRQYGYDGFTDISYMNNYFFARENNLLLPELAENDSLRYKLEELVQQSVKNHGEIWREIHQLEKYDHNYSGMNRVVERSLMAQPRRCLSGLLRRTAIVGSYRMWDFHFGQREHQIYSVFVPRMSVLYLFLVVYLCFMIWQWRRARSFPLVGFFLWGFVVCSHLAAIAGAQDEWSRLTYQSFPCALLLLGKILSVFSLKSGNALTAALKYHG